ncbi:MAG: hypothetical protein QOC87_1727 [Actinomycetota bacterium]|nr:hypothetical protein [Actinomycetota bacterium]
MLTDVILFLLSLVVIGLSLKMRSDYVRRVHELYGPFSDEVDREKREQKL